MFSWLACHNNCGAVCLEWWIFFEHFLARTGQESGVTAEGEKDGDRRGEEQGGQTLPLCLVDSIFFLHKASQHTFFLSLCKNNEHSPQANRSVMTICLQNYVRNSVKTFST